jgi:hypothetical protein
MSEVAKTEIFIAHSADARYAVDLVTRMCKAIDAEMSRRADDGLRYRDEEDVRALLGSALWDEVCHAIGWDIDWDAVNRGTQG